MKRLPFYIIAFLLCTATAVQAQYKVKGTVYDSSRIYPIEGVTIHSTAGRTVVTDTNGHYSIDVAERDSVWFFFQGKPTPKYPVLSIPDVTQFDLALRLKMDVMQEVKIRTRNYKEDSAQNRRDYAKAFNFHRPTVGSMTSIGPTGAGIDLQEVIRLFQFRKNRSMEHFKLRLEQEEKDKFIDRRFSKLLIKRLTGIEKDDELTAFMKAYRPTFEFATGTSDYEFQFYIKVAYGEFKKSRLPGA